MDRRQQLQQRRRMHARAGGPHASGVETTTSNTPTPTSTSKSSPIHTTSSTSTSTTPTSTSTRDVHTTSSSTSPLTDSTLSSSSFSLTTSVTSSSSSVSSTPSTTSSSSLQKPTTMTGMTTSTDYANPLQSTPSLTNPTNPTHTINGNDSGPSGNVATKSISGGTIAAIIFGGIAGTAALLIVFCFIRRKMRPRRRRHDWHARNSFVRGAAAFPEESARPVIGTRNALALARANMGHDADAHEPEMTQMNPPAAPVPSHWGAYGGNAQEPFTPYQDQYQYLQPAQPHFELQDPRDAQQHDNYGYQGYQEPQDEKYAELARQLEAPAVAFSPHPDSRAEERNSPPTLGRTLSTSAYGSLSAREPSPSHPTRSGTPVDANPQQAYVAPNFQTGHNASVPGLHNGPSVYDDQGGAYGGM